MTTAPTDTPKRDEADLDAFETWFASLTRMERDQRFSASYFMREAWNAALRLPTPPSQGKVEIARELLAQIFYAFDFTSLGHRIQKDGLTDREKTELQIRGVTQALTESSGQTDPEAAAILCTLGCVPDSTDLSETDAKVSVGFLRRLIGSYDTGAGLTDTTSTRPTMDELRDILAQEFSANGESGYADAVFGGKSDPIIKAALVAMSRVRSTTGAETAWIIRLRELADAMLEAKTDRHCTGKIFVELSDVELLKNVASHLEVTTPREKP